MPLTRPPIIRVLACVAWALAIVAAVDPGALKGAIARWLESGRWPPYYWGYVLFMAGVATVQVLIFDRIARWPGVPRGHALVNAFAYSLVVVSLVLLSGHHSPFVATGVAAFTQGVGTLLIGAFLTAKWIGARRARVLRPGE